MRHHTWKSAASAVRAVSAVLIVLSSLALAGCGDDSDGGSDGGSNGGSMPGMTHGSPTTSATSTTSTSPTAPAGDFNDADVTFATQMIPHHRQAVQMSNMAIRKATKPALKRLAAAINAAQGPEITQMSGWLTSWGKPAPSPGHGGHGTSEMPGMMTEDEMSDLGNATGTMFDRMWIQMMIDHHKGAVTMAKTEQTSGKNTEAIALAKKIETDQNREIATLQRLLGQLTTR
jgi:uncharacterized protein (DUF305 family)